MPNKDRKMFNITKKLHIKIIMMYHPIPIRNVKSKILKIQNADGNIEKQYHHSLLVKVQNGALEDS